ncbi:MAG: deoxyguanosinetriphosphate triphosphohydrolase [Oscillospiraceae bacterium]|jgi:dGTPase|nr:deoxyguanosinetriphosphate triphosphohydrolase [Oscillospiraceae bacterium]
MNDLIRRQTEQTEHMTLAPNAAFADASQGRMRKEPECPMRTCYVRDADRILHSKAFRRLKHKTQVFLAPEGDHYRTRMTHTLEVVSIAKTIARALRLNEDLTVAIAYGHDIGHTPFGHAGERALNTITGNFRHNEQSLRAADSLEKSGAGLNLTHEVRDGILNHTSSGKPATAEGKVVQISDRLAYVCHDTDDAIRAGVITAEALPRNVIYALGKGYSQRINALVSDVIENSIQTGIVGYSASMRPVAQEFYGFLYETVYVNPEVKSEERKVFGILERLYEYYLKAPIELPNDYIALISRYGTERIVADYIAGMTDRYATNLFVQLFVPRGSS